MILLHRIVLKVPRHSLQEPGPGAPALVVADFSLVSTSLGPQPPWELSADSTATPGGRRRESQLSGPEATAV